MAQKQTKVVVINGVQIQVYALKVLAAELHRCPETLRRWEFTRFIPKPIFKTMDGFRWYTQEEVDMYKRLYAEEADNLQNGKKFSNTKFSERLFCEVALLKQQIIGGIAKEAAIKKPKN